LNYANRLPKARKAILGGWELSGILAVQSGVPYSGLVNFDLNNDGNSQTDRTPGQPRNTFRQPTTVSIDPRVTRNVAIKEQLRLQFIGEAFNVFNRANVTDVRTIQYARSSSCRRPWAFASLWQLPASSRKTSGQRPLERLPQLWPANRTTRPQLLF